MRNEELGIRHSLADLGAVKHSTSYTIEPAAAGCVETGSPKGFPETRKPQASAETRARSDR